MRRRFSGIAALAGVAATATLASFTASAADLPVPAATYNPPPVYRPGLYNWTGFYFGGHVGVGAMRDVVTTLTTTALQPIGTVTGLTPYSIIAGPQAGFNLEIAPIVLGVEATWSLSNVSGSQVTPSPLVGGTSEKSTDFAHWYATATGRVGYALNDLLIYAKGGGAWMDVGNTQAVVAGPVISTQTIYATRMGYVVGGGLEYGMNENLSGKLEYDYLNFGIQNYSFNNLSTAAGAIGLFPVSIKSQSQMLSLGLNYRFNFGGGGPPARY